MDLRLALYDLAAELRLYGPALLRLLGVAGLENTQPAEAPRKAAHGATVLGAAAHGMRERLDPGAPVEGNGYAQAGARTLPGSWREALDLAARSEFLEETLGKDLLKVFLAIKNQECARFSAEVSELDYAWYLRS